MTSDDVDVLRDSIKALAARIRRQQPTVDGLTRTELHVLTVAERSSETLRPGQIANELRMTTPNVAAALRKLEAMAFIRRNPDPTDGRQRVIVVTDAGQGVVADTRRSRHAWLDQAIEDTCSAEERSILLRAAEIIQRLSEYGERSPRHSASPKTDKLYDKASGNGCPPAHLVSATLKPKRA